MDKDRDAGAREVCLRKVDPALIFQAIVTANTQHLDGTSGSEDYRGSGAPPPHRSKSRGCRCRPRPPRTHRAPRGAPHRTAAAAPWRCRRRSRARRRGRALPANRRSTGRSASHRPACRRACASWERRDAPVVEVACPVAFHLRDAKRGQPQVPRRPRSRAGRGPRSSAPTPPTGSAPGSSTAPGS